MHTIDDRFIYRYHLVFLEVINCCRLRFNVSKATVDCYCYAVQYRANIRMDGIKGSAKYWYIAHNATYRHMSTVYVGTR